jgi:hypothetical protein
MKLHVTAPELVIIFNGQVHEVQPVVFIQQGMGILQRIMRRHHKPYLVNIGMRYYMIGYDQVAGMNGIKTPEI